MDLYTGLIHYPVLNRNSQKIASALTTVDLHDLARLARTYEVKRFFIITPLQDQQVFAGRILRHWTEGFGASYNPNRAEALELVTVTSSLPEAESLILNERGERPVLIATAAEKKMGKMLSYEGARGIIRCGRAVMLLFGTAWGLDREVFDRADYVLEPIVGRGEYNHLSVRSAAAIILDRLVGR